MGSGSTWTMRMRIASQKSGSPHVLVVDDTEVIRSVLFDMLSTLGCTVDVFESGEAVIEYVAGGAVFDFILMDCQMPNLDGTATTRRLLQEYPDRDIRVVAISAHGAESDRAKQRQSGMMDHLPKPFRLADLQGLLNRMG